MFDLHWVDSPDDDGEATDGGVEASDLAALRRSSSTTVDDELPEDDQVGDACNGIPAPLLSSFLVTEGSEETGQDHDEIGNDGDEHAASAGTGQEHQIDEQEWCRKGPINVTGPVNLTVEILVGVRDVLVLLGLDGVVEADTMTSGHCEVRHGGEDDNHGGDDVVETLGLCKESVYVLGEQRWILTIGMFHDMPVKTIEATSMTTKTTLISGQLW